MKGDTMMGPTIETKTLNISGMGSGYEDMCQRMLWRGSGRSLVNWLRRSSGALHWEDR